MDKLLAKEKEEIILLRRRLETDANHWQALRQNDPQKATDELWGGSKLERILELMKDEAIKGIAEPVKQFIQASVAWRDRTQREQQKQIEELNRALTESRLREQAATIPNILRFDSLRALVKTICMAGENLDKLPSQILPPVQIQLRETMEAARISLPLEGHESKVTCVAISVDNQWLVSGSSDNTLRVWEARSGTLLHTLQGHESGVNCVAISADSQWLVSGSSDNTLRVWDAQSGTLLHTLQGHEYFVRCVAISADSQWFVSGSEDGTLRVWRASLLSYLAVCCNRIRYHPAFKNPQTEDEKSAYDIANRYVYNPQVGADELYRKAKQKITAKDYTAAVGILTLAIQLNPDHLPAYRDRAHLFGHLQQYYRAIKDCDRILQIQPDTADIYSVRGLCYTKLDKLELAKADYQQAITFYEQQENLEKAQKISQKLTP